MIAAIVAFVFSLAAGNSGLNTDYSPNYPSGFDAANIIAVAATGSREHHDCQQCDRPEPN